jgi:hypothetical protein
MSTAPVDGGGEDGTCGAWGAFAPTALRGAAPEPQSESLARPRRLRDRGRALGAGGDCTTIHVAMVHSLHCRWRAAASRRHPWPPPIMPVFPNCGTNDRAPSGTVCTTASRASPCVARSEDARAGPVPYECAPPERRSGPASRVQVVRQLLSALTPTATRRSPAATRWHHAHPTPRARGARARRRGLRAVPAASDTGLSGSSYMLFRAPDLRSSGCRAPAGPRLPASVPGNFTQARPGGPPGFQSLYIRNV